MESKPLVESDVNYKKPTKNKDFFYIIGIGSSAGGLKALEQFFDNCPSDTGFAFVIVQHLSPDYKSLMPELLSRHTKMSIKEAKEDDEVLPNHAYLIPGSKNITLENGFLKLSQRPPSSQMNFSIDIFFTSLAKEQKDKTIGIILSGTGSDGTKGAKLIKEAGGTVFVQDPDTSKFDGMPKSAISQGLADYVLDPRDMGRELMEFVLHPPISYFNSTEESNKSVALDRVLRIIKNHVGYDFFSYKKPTLLRRTAKRINITKSKTVENYIDYLYDNPEEKFLLTQEFLIGVTKFFRDSSAFSIIEKEIIPSIVTNALEKGKALKLWSVGCSTGEEAYSMAILIEEYISQHKLNLDYKIFATDIDDRAVDGAAKGVFGENIATDVSESRLANFFIKKDNNTYQIHSAIRKNIIFSKHDILQNPPFNKMDLVSCRNVLIYMENNIQLQALTSIHYSLNQGGYLFLGSSEHLGLLTQNFEEVNSKWKIYKNIQSEGVINIAKNDVWRVEKGGLRPQKSTKGLRTMEDLMSKSVNQVLINEFQVVNVCIDESFEILQASGNLKKYLNFPDEGFSNNLLKVLPDELNIPITTNLQNRAT